MNRKVVLLISLLFLGFSSNVKGQASVCPPNVDFELGNTSVWNFFNGTVATGPAYIFPVAPSVPIPVREKLTTGPALDRYGGFPIVAPGGGAYSCMLGSDTQNNCAERAVYYVEIPPGTTTYQLVYHYAAVLEVPLTGHLPSQEPRFVVGAYDSATGSSIPCAAYTYVSGGAASGFIASPVRSNVPGNGFDVVYKPWTFGNMKFPGENGRTVAVEFTANDCTLGAHWGYGYLDMSCGLFANVIACGTTSETLTAPPGFASYQWLDSTTMATSYGTTETIVVPAPGVPTTYAVIITPFTGYGCPDTLYSRLIPSHLVLNPSNDTTICSGNSVTMNSGATDIASPLTYDWAPALGLSCTTCATPLASPTATTSYTVTVTDPGGCSLSHVFNITVFPTPAPIGGSLNACLGATTSLTDGVGGGVWNSLNTAAATIGSSTGIVTGNALDTATITYSFGAGLCMTSTVITVNPVPAPITGSIPVCPGSTITLADVTTGGTWTSGSLAIATVDPSSGTVTGVAALGGTATITFTVATGCNASADVTVNPLSPITGTMSVCTGLTTTLADITPGGTWSSSDFTVATVDATGIVTGVATAGGTATITYTTPALCVATATVTVNPLPLPVGGTLSVCAGSTTTLTDASTGGTWSSSNPAEATVGTTTGVAGGVDALGGTSIISYTLPTGCPVTAILTVNPLSPITGIMNICTGLTTTLSDAAVGGTWLSSSPLIATVDALTGVVTGVATAGGTTLITYTTPAGCVTTATVTVNPLPLAITGTASICEGFTTTLHDASTGGTWSSAATTVATVVPTSGLVSSAGPGTATISYTLGTGCLISTVVTVNPTPPIITGPGTVCTGSAILLGDAITGGTWTSSSTGIATAGLSTGVVGGVSVVGGTSTITYTSPAGCVRTTVVTVNPLPSAITGTLTVCAGLTTTLRDATTGGIWTSGSPTMATVAPGTGIVTGVLPGTSIITYTLPTGCSVSAIVTVNVTPVAIGGTPRVCVGSTTGLTDATTGGTWTSGSTGIATIGSATGIVTGVAAAGGTSIITYALATGCSATITVTSNPLPTIFAVTGGGTYCLGSTLPHVGLSGSTSGVIYQLFNGPTTVGAPVLGTGSALDFGAIAGPGTFTVVAINATTGCSSNMSGSVTITVNPVPGPFAITGGGTLCSGGAGVHVGLSGSAVGVNYQLHAGIFISPIMAGTGGGLDFGPETFPGVYTVTATYPLTGCSSIMTGTATVTVLPLPTAFTVTGGGGYCAGGAGVPIGLSGSTPGTTYSLFNGGTGVAVAAGTGSPLNFGLHTAAGTYTIVATTVATGCTGPMTGSATITINPLPDPISGPSTVCVGATITETDDSTGGTWSSSIPANATVGTSTGIVTGVTSASTTVITYTLPTGCTATRTITVSLSPAAISGPSAVCVGSTITETDAVPGVWSSSAPPTATVVAGTGVVTGLAAGTATITITVPATGCFMLAPVTVNPLPFAITGTTSVCVGLATTLHETSTGGTWSSSNTGVATVLASGVVTGAAPGTSSITYTLPTGCVTSITVTVFASPAPISGPSSVCQNSSITLSDAVTGGTWTSSNLAVATIGVSNGIVSPIAPTSTIITYTLPGSCTVTKVVTVNPILPIAGTFVVCQGSTITLTDGAAGGTWGSSVTSVATVNASTGVVGGVTPGTTVITYTTAAGCTASATVTVNLTPAPITGVASVCVGSSTVLVESVTGGSWTSSSLGVATITGTGTVYGVTAGTSTISYFLPTGCAAIVVVTVNPLPVAITGTMVVCQRLTTTLVDATTGGTWSVTPSITATVNSTTGTVTGVSSGNATVTYTISLTGCATSTVITVNPVPAPITGPMSICVGYTTNLNETTRGGTWSSTVTSVATVGTPVSTSDSVFGVSSGTSIISYTLPTGCAATAQVTVVPVPSTITGPPMVCEGLIALVSVPGAPGGAWSTGDIAIATVTPTSGILTGVASGTVIVSYTIGASCYVFGSIIVNALSPITGDSVFCVGQTVVLTDTTLGGIWSSDDPGVASATTASLATGTSGGLSAGTATIKYTLPTGCVATDIVTVNPLPAPISGVTNVCIESTTTLSDATTGGTWSSSDDLIATVDAATGVVTGVAAGPVTIYYTVTATGCPRGVTVMVNQLPTPISGPDYVCPGTTITLSDLIAGGTWSVVPSTVASIGTTSGVLDGLSPGTATATYTLPLTGCSTSSFITVEPWTDAITGTMVACVGGSTHLSDATFGGVWSSSNTSIATVDFFSGMVSGVALGTATITYTTSLGCTATTVVSVEPSPAPITGPMIVCQGSTTTLSDITLGGAWTSITPSVATVGTSTGVVTGVGGGTATIEYTLGGFCASIAVVTVNPLPAGIGGPSHVCSTGTATLSDATSGGEWSSSDLTVATIAPFTGFITGVLPGTTTVTYTLPIGCALSRVIIIDSMPTAIVGPTRVCRGSTISLTDPVSGGTWTSSIPAIASVGSSTGIVTGAAPGSTDVSYIIGACHIESTITVNDLPLPFNVTGGGSYCEEGLGEHIGLDGSTVGIMYYLYHGATATGTFAGTGAPLDFGYQTVAGSYTVVAVSTSTACSNIMSGSALITIIPSVPTSVRVTVTPDSSVCAGTTVNFNTVSVNGGHAPSYQWSVNSVHVGTGGTYSFVPADGDIVTVAMTSDTTCPLPAIATGSVTMIVHVPAYPVVGVLVTPGDTVCGGTEVTFTALPSFGGSLPSYLWTVNGTVSGIDPIYSYVPANGDVVYCKLTSNYPCRLADTALSSPNIMTVDTPMIPIVSIISSPGTEVGIGSFDTLTAVVENGGAHPSYQWLLNAIPVAGATSNIYISRSYSFPNEDSVSCVVTADNPCHITSFQWVYIKATNVGVIQVLSGNSDIVVLPNPNKGEFTVKGSLGTTNDEDVSFEITDMLGRVVYRNTTVAHGGTVNERITMTNNIANGMYLLNVHSDVGSKVFHIVVEQ